MFSKKLKLPVALALVGMVCNAHAAIETIDFTATTLFGSAFPNQGPLNQIAGSISFDPNTAFVTSSGTSGSAIDLLNYGSYVNYSFSSPAPFTFTTDGGLSRTQNLTNIAILTSCSNGQCINQYSFQAHQSFQSFDGGYHATVSDLDLHLGTNNLPNQPLRDFSIPRALNLADFPFNPEVSYTSNC